jgi:phenylalanyl-tRNA synthetase alpha subunit
VGLVGRRGDQIEGLIADRNLTLGDLIGTISTFFKRIGITDVKFKPAYNPYTEPSMEIFGFSPQLNKWMELGNSGQTLQQQQNKYISCDRWRDRECLH